MEASAQPDSRPTFMDVFAGCGGLSLGLKRAGWKGLLAIEKDPNAFETVTANFPSGDGPLSYSWPNEIERRAWDIHELLSQRRQALEGLAGKVDLLAGGPPCQGFSQAGPRRPDDPRNTLFLAYLELVELLHPRFVLIENVQGFASDFKARGSGSVTNFAEALKRGIERQYDIMPAVIRASDFGVPQMRPRFFLVGALKEMGAKGRIEAFFDDLRAVAPVFLSERQLRERPCAKDAIGDLEVGKNGRIPCEESKGFEKIGYKAPRTAYQRAMRDGYNGVPSCTRLARHRPHIRERFASIIAACKREKRLSTSLSSKMRSHYRLRKTSLRVLDPNAPAPTITSLPDDLLHYSEPRTLTVRENARLQSFPDWFEFKGNYTTGGNRRRNEVPRFTQVANAIPPLLAEQIGLALLRIHLTFEESNLLLKD